MDRRDDFIDEIRRLFEELTAFTSMGMGRGFVPTPGAQSQRKLHEDAVETESEYIITLELPGILAQDIFVGAGKRAIEIEVNDRDNPDGGFLRTYPTEVDIKPKDLRITHKNGILEVRALKK
jgi:HSP20 family molecular chaperone IbpA